MTNVVGIWDGLSWQGSRPTVSVIIPALNEERNLPHIAAHMPPDVDEVVFVNGQSRDNTAALAREIWPDGVHVHQTRKGKGNALACGFAAASGDIVVMIDADGSTDPAEIPRFVGALASGADFAKGSRFVQGGGSADITRLRQLGNMGFNVLVNLLFRTKYTDLCYGYNAFWRRCLDVLELPATNSTTPEWGDGFEIETLINVRAAASGFKIAEVCSYESTRLHGASNLNAARDGLRILWTIQREFRRARPMFRRSSTSIGPASDSAAVSQSMWVRRRSQLTPKWRRGGRIHIEDGFAWRLADSRAEDIVS